MLDVLNQVTGSLTAADQMFALTETEVRGNKMKVWANAPASLRDVWLSTAQHADKEYLVYGDERWTYTQAHSDVARIANWLTSNGIQPGDRVAIAMRNYPEWMLYYWAIASIGAVAVGINAWWVAEELKYGLNDSQVKIMICDTERLTRFAKIAQDFPDLQVVAVRTDKVPEWATAWDAVLQSDPQLPEVSIDTDDDVCIFYTSGTTEFPKGAQLTHRSCVNQLFSALFASLSQNTANALLKGQQPPNPMDPNAQPPSGLIATPLFHVTANNAMAHSLTVTGGKLVHMYKWDAGEALRLIEQERITNFTGVPAMSREMINHPDFAMRDLSSLASLGGGGAPVQPDLIEKIDSKGGQAVPAQGYGLTETCGMVSGSYGVFLSNKPNSAGILVPVCQVKTINEQGDDLPTGEIGEICLYGPHIIRGYLNRPDATSETIVDGWLHTGDIGYVDEENFIYLVDRAKDMVIRGGENIYCSEVEAACYRYTGVAECAAFAVPDERLGEEIGCAIYAATDSTIDPDQLRDFLKAKLAAFKIPRYIWILDKPLPLNASGKFLKRALQQSLDIADAH
jgi:acyl-CoA synthetase (AMP-forming)/AMP-acid ligase II